MNFIRKPSRTLTVPVTVSAGAAKDAGDLKSVSLSFSLNGAVGTWQCEVSYDNGTSFVQTGSNLTADANLTIPEAATQIRIRCTAFTSGLPKVAYAGLPLVAGA